MKTARRDERPDTGRPPPPVREGGLSGGWTLLGAVTLFCFGEARPFETCKDFGRKLGGKEREVLEEKPAEHLQASLWPTPLCTASSRKLEAREFKVRASNPAVIVCLDLKPRSEKSRSPSLWIRLSISKLAVWLRTAPWNLTFVQIESESPDLHGLGVQKSSGAFHITAESRLRAMLRRLPSAAGTTVAQNVHNVV